uniref:LAGLIDADG endonuclease n=1 Tax=Chrysoporthe austroafricana TaxID=354353 RepID=A0A191MWZ0_9PEZI|nr:LAGLIDADG endonuclease [Chrysoporthe austroafricana]AMX22063.1 LAGLIDADG endonuclease [Chrysoporthe austroafricana]
MNFLMPLINLNSSERKPCLSEKYLTPLKGGSSFVRMRLGNYNRPRLHLNKKLYSTHVKSSIVNSIDIKSWFVTGLIDAEGSFITSLRKTSARSCGWEVQSMFKLGLHTRDLPLLEAIQSYLGGIGSINKSGDSLLVYRVSSLKDLAIILDHFSRYPLITQKRADFELFKRVVSIRESGRHVTLEGLQEIVNIRASMNKGLTDELRIAFPKTIPVIRPIVTEVESKIPDPEWVAGFVSGEGNFSIGITKSVECKTGHAVQLRFKLTQHSRDELLLKSFISYFDCGTYYKYPNKPLGDYRCVNFVDINNKLLPFFKKYPILGVKSLDFNDWCLGAEIMQNKSHLTPEGLACIKAIKEGMNKGR